MESSKLNSEPPSTEEEMRRVLASASQWQDWTCWIYTVLGHRLVLHAERPSLTSPTVEQAYLTFRLPTRVRLPWYLYDESIRFELGSLSSAGAPSQSESVPWRVRIHASAQTYEIDCAGVEFRRGRLGRASRSHPSTDLFYRADLCIRLYDGDSEQQLQQFLGGSFRTLEWSGLLVGLGQLRLLSYGFPGGGAVELRCVGTSYMDLGATMTRPRLHIANAQESAALRDTLPPNLQRDTYPPHQLPYELSKGEAPRPGDRDLGNGHVSRPGAHAGHLIIDCEEGRFQLLTAQVVLRRLCRRNYTFSRSLGPLFREGGPPVAER